MHRLRWIGKDFADLLAFSIAMRVYSMQVRKKKKKGLMWLSLASLLISLYSMAWATEGHDIGSCRPHIVQAFALVLFLSCHIPLISAETKASCPCILLESSSHLACIATRFFCFGSGLLCFFRRRMRKRGVSIIFYSSYPVLLGGIIPIHLLWSVPDIMNSCQLPWREPI